MTNVSPERMEELRKKYGPGRQDQPSSLTDLLASSQHEARQLGDRLNKLQTLSIVGAIGAAILLIMLSATWYSALGAALILYLLAIHVGKFILRKHSQKRFKKHIDTQLNSR